MVGPVGDNQAQAPFQQSVQHLLQVAALGRGKVVATPLHDVARPPRRGLRRLVRVEELDVSQHDAADLRVGAAVVQRPSPVLKNSGTHFPERRAAVVLPEKLPRAGHRQGCPTTQEATADNHVAMRVVRLEEEWRALGDRPEPAPPTGLPEVHLCRVPPMQKPVPVPVRDSDVRAHGCHTARPNRILIRLRIDARAGSSAECPKPGAPSAREPRSVHQRVTATRAAALGHT